MENAPNGWGLYLNDERSSPYVRNGDFQMQISIASGKGGTGKTTVATNLALSIGSNVNLLDCDVEGPGTEKISL
mgnify:CR=1 FL=1